MLIGNRNTVGIEISPLQPTWERRYPPERTAWGALSIWIGGANICEHVDPGSEEVQKALNVPLAPIADWFVRAWPYVAFEERAVRFPTGAELHGAIEQWGIQHRPSDLTDDQWIDSREEWWSRHFILAGANGAILPNLALARQDEKLILDWAQPRLLSGGAPRLLQGMGSGAVPWKDAEATLAAFVSYVADWLRSEGLDGVYSWVVLQDPLRSSAREPWADLALFTGRSGDELRRLTQASSIDEAFARLGLEPNAADPAASPVTQALRDLPPSLPPAASALLAKLDAGTRAGDAPGLWRMREVVSPTEVWFVCC